MYRFLFTMNFYYRTCRSKDESHDNKKKRNTRFYRDPTSTNRVFIDPIRLGRSYKSVSVYIAHVREEMMNDRSTKLPVSKMVLADLHSTVPGNRGTNALRITVNPGPSLLTLRTSGSCIRRHRRGIWRIRGYYCYTPLFVPNVVAVWSYNYHFGKFSCPRVDGLGANLGTIRIKITRPFGSRRFAREIPLPPFCFYTMFVHRGPMTRCPWGQSCLHGLLHRDGVSMPSDYRSIKLSHGIIILGVADSWVIYKYTRGVDASGAGNFSGRSTTSPEEISRVLRPYRISGLLLRKSLLRPCTRSLLYRVKYYGKIVSLPMNPIGCSTASCVQYCYWPWESRGRVYRVTSREEEAWRLNE